MMSQNKNKGKRRADEPEDDRPSQKARKEDASHSVLLTSSEAQKIVSNMVRFALFKENKKEHLTDGHISQYVLDEYSGKKGTKSYALKNADKVLNHIFGMRLTEMTSFNTKAQSKKYIVQNNLATYADHLEWVEQSAERAFLMMILCVIFVSDTCNVYERFCEEDKLWDSLAQLGVKRTSKNHPELGNVENLMKTFTSQQYIAHVKEKGYGFSSRTATEITFSFLYQYIHIIFGMRLSPQACKQQLPGLEDIGEEIELVDLGGPGASQ